MHLVLIPGFWLDASSWDAVVPVLEQAGHTVQPLTLPGLESRSADRTGIGLRHHVDAVVSAIDEAPGRVVLVGHSGGGAIAYAAADARPDLVARLVFVDCVPLGAGRAINDALPVMGGEIPLPDWSVFDEADLRDLDAPLRDQFRARAIPEPRGVAHDGQVLTDERRHHVPATVICCEFSADQLRGWIAQDSDLAELAAMREVTYVDLPTGHWPQFTRPDELAHAIAGAVAADADR